MQEPSVGREASEPCLSGQQRNQICVAPTRTRLTASADDRGFVNQKDQGASKRSERKYQKTASLKVSQGW